MRTMRLVLALAAALGPASPAFSQVRAAPSLVSSLPSALVPALTVGGGAAAGPFAAGAALAPALAPSLPSAPPALAPSAIPAAAFAPAPALAAPAASAAAAADRPAAHLAGRSGEILHSFRELSRAARPDAEAGALFDGSAARSDADAFVPAGVALQSRVRLDGPKDVVSFIPYSGNSAEMIDGLRARWADIGWLDLRIYRDAKGEYFRTLDLTGRPELAAKLPELQPHEVSHIAKIALTARDLQLVIREQGKTPDLIVDGVVTEMKSLHPSGQLEVQLSHANAQLAAHAERHGLGLGAISIDLMHRDAVPLEETRRALAAFVASEPRVAAARVEVYAGAERRVFVRGKDGSFRLKPAQRSHRGPARFVAPSTLAAAQGPDLGVVARELTEPARLLAARGVKATVTVYGSARILSPDAAREAVRRAAAESAERPSDPEARRRLADAKRAARLSRWYRVAVEFGALVAREGGGEVAVVTGGGPGIMEAANRGAFEAGGPSVGYNIILEKEQGLNEFTTPGLSFEFQNFSTRKTALRHGAMGLVYFPGGFGTMDELFEVLTLMQTKKMPRTPIVLVGERAYWEKILDFRAFEDMGLISPGDLSLFVFADNARSIWNAVSRPAATAR